MTLTTGNNVILSKTDKTGKTLTVTIATIPTDEENLTKTLFVIGFPTDTASQTIDAGAKDPKIVDLLLKPEHRITVDGFLVTGVGSSDTSNTAEGKKSDLKGIFFAGNTFNMTYEGSTFEANMDKLSIKRIDTDGQAQIDGLAEFSIKFTVVRGTAYG